MVQPLRGGLEPGADFCVEALEDKGKPEVFNTDQGGQFTIEGFIGLLEQHGVRISMDGKGRYSDNIFVERLWRTVTMGSTLRLSLSYPSKPVFPIWLKQVMR